MCLVSVILPSYNVDKYISKCLNSILTQTFQELEVLVVDDESTDNTRSIALDFAKNDERVRIIEQRHTGPSEARNTGIKNAYGKYIIFIDPDDWIESSMLEDMVNLAEKHNADIVIGGVCVEYEDEGRTENFSFQEKVFFSNNDNFGLLFWNLMKVKLSHYVWNRIFRADLIKENGLEFPLILPSEDLFFNIDAFNSAQTIVTTSNIYNHYIRRKVSVLSSFSPLTFDVSRLSVKKFEEMFAYYSLKGKEYDDFLLNLRFSHYSNVPINIHRSGAEKNKKRRITWLKKYVYEDDRLGIIVKQYIKRYSFFNRPLLSNIFLFALHFPPFMMDNMYRQLMMLKNTFYGVYLKLRKFLVS